MQQMPRSSQAKRKRKKLEISPSDGSYVTLLSEESSDVRPPEGTRDEEKKKKKRKRPEVAPAEVFTKLYEVIVRQRSNNVVLAPMSVELVLSLFVSGVRGQAAEEISTFFGKRRSTDIVIESFDSIMTGAKHPREDIVLKVAHRLYSDTTFQIESNFKALAKKGFFTEMAHLDFQNSPEESLKTINNWMSMEYKGKIRQEFRQDGFTSNTKLVLLNVIYFKGKWKYRFHTQKTKKEPFHITSNSVKDVEMMNNKQFYGYRELRDVKATMLVMPYVGDKICLVIILPNEIDGISEVERLLPSMNLMQEIQLVSHPQVEVSLPRFRIENTLDLTKDLIQMGIVSLFDSGSDLPGLTKNRGACINTMLQKTVVEVDESGSVDSGYVYPGPISASPLQTFKVDHPFMFCVVNVQCKNVLFIGRVKFPDARLPSVNDNNT